MSKKLSEKIKINIAASLFSAYIVPMVASLRWEVISKSNFDGACILAIWHGMQFLNCSTKKADRKRHNLLISPSNDGEIIAKTSANLGFSSIRGSSKRRGSTAALEIISAIENGENISYTIDGPKGPIYKVKPGIIKLAQLSKAPIIPLGGACDRSIVIPSWDKYEIPHFFARCIAIKGEPIYIPQELSPEDISEYQQELEKKLFVLDKEAKEVLNAK